VTPQQKLQAIRKTLNHEQITKGDEVVFFCPRCNHHKPKLSVNLLTEIFHCWICDWKGKNIAPLLEKNSKEKQEYIEELKEKSLTPVAKQEKKYDPLVLPIEFKTLSKEWSGPYYKAAVRYLSERGIEREDILKWKLGYCEDGDYKYRIIIPSFDDYGHLNFFTGRAFYDNNPKKYKNGNFCKDIIFNDYLIDWNKPITITEGPFDAFKISKNAIALQGSTLSYRSKLFSKIVLSGVDVHFAMDTDAFEKQLDIIDNFLSYGVTCHYVNLNGKKDVGEMTKSEFDTVASRSIEIKSDLDILRMRARV